LSKALGTTWIPVAMGEACDPDDWLGGLEDAPVEVQLGDVR
jgi:hypothetical protein